MGKKLNINASVIVQGSVSDLLNGALTSLAGPVGFSLNQPRLIVKRIQVINPSTSLGTLFAIYKGASGGHAAGTEVIYASINQTSTIDLETDLVLDASDFLTGTCISSGSLTVNISAEIEF